MYFIKKKVMKSETVEQCRHQNCFWVFTEENRLNKNDSVSSFKFCSLYLNLSD